MYNVHWADPEKQWYKPYLKTNLGLGFMHYEGWDDSKLVGHGGNCPGYRSFLILNLKKGIYICLLVVLK